LRGLLRLWFKQIYCKILSKLFFIRHVIYNISMQNLNIPRELNQKEHSPAYLMNESRQIECAEYCLRHTNTTHRFIATHEERLIRTGRFVYYSLMYDAKETLFIADEIENSRNVLLDYGLADKVVGDPAVLRATLIRLERIKLIEVNNKRAIRRPRFLGFENGNKQDEQFNHLYWRQTDEDYEQADPINKKVHLQKPPRKVLDFNWLRPGMA
jgi:hypothetical protein